MNAIETLRAALEPDYVLIGGGNAGKLKELPENVCLGDNENAFLGASGFGIPTRPPASPVSTLRARGSRPVVPGQSASAA